MKRFAVSLCFGACLATLGAAADAASRIGVAPGRAFARGLPRPVLVGGRISPTRAVPPAFGQRGRRPRLPVFWPVIGTGDGGDIGPDPPDAPGFRQGEPPAAIGPIGITLVQTPVDLTERYVSPTGATIIPTNPGPRIIYVSDKPSKRRHARIPTVIYGISLATR